MGDIICAIGSESSARSAISQSSDCYDIYKLGLPLPGVYDLKSLGSVQCLQGGWTSIQHRGQYGNPKNYFSKNWIDYVQGFGRPGTYTAVYCFIHPIFLSFGFWYFCHFSCAIFFLDFFHLALQNVNKGYVKRDQHQKQKMG